MIRRESLLLVMALMIVVVTLAITTVFVLPNPTPLLLGLLFIPLACSTSIVATRAPQRA